ncbi:MAG: sugar phosphate isomerase/epimerase [Planctomycetes bacterium]|nr:sugar phosphate isomerase/epimerase [Planctomycetota bacterium]
MKLSLSSHLLVFSGLQTNSLKALEDCQFSDLELWLAEPHIPWRNAEKLAAFKQQLDDFGLKVPSVHLPFYPSVPELLNENQRWSVIDTDVTQRRVAVAGAIQGLNAAATLGAKCAVLHLGWQQDTWTDSSNGWAREAVTELMAAAKKSGVRLLLENIISTGTRVSKLIELLDEIDPHNEVGICLDLGHANIEGDVAEELMLALPRLDHIHLHDNDGCSDSHLCPGSGCIYWPQVIQILRDHGFSGHAALELRDYSRGEHTASQIIDTHLESSADFINNWSTT